MKIVLLKDIKKVGRAGDIVEVADGYGRNYLIKQNLAKLATQDIVSQREKMRQAQQASVASSRRHAKKIAKKLGSTIFEFTLPADKSGNLYAGLKEPDIIAKIKEGGDVPFALSLPGYVPLKQIGEHRVKIKLENFAEIQIILWLKGK